MFALAFNQPRQLKGEHSIIKGIVGLWELPFLFSLRPHLYSYLCALLVPEPLFQRVE